MSLLYPEVGDVGGLLIVLTLSMLVAAAGTPASVALASADKAAHLAPVVLLAAFVNLGAVLLLLPAGGLLGAAYGTLLAECVGAAGRWIALRRAVGSRRPKIAQPDQVRHV
jgi:Na+-driven multidrug efflux pump